MSVVSMKELLEAGVHFGHQTRRWEPRMAPYIFTKRKGIHILDLQKTVKYIDEAYKYVKEQASHGKTVLFVGTKKQAQSAIKIEAERCEMPYVNYRWLGGMLTNFKTISKSKEKLEKLDAVLNDEKQRSNYTKKELLNMTKQRDKLLKVFEGIRKMNALPDLLFVIDTRMEETAVNEARKLGIPLVAVVDTNCNPEIVDYPMPGNDDAIRAVGLFSHVIAQAVIDGRKDMQEQNEGQDLQKQEDKDVNVAYVTRIDEASDEDIENRSFTANGQIQKPEESETVSADADSVSETSSEANESEPVKTEGE